MAFSNTNYTNYLINNATLVPSESVWSPVIDTTHDMRIVLQIDSTTDQSYNPPANPSQSFQVALYNIAYLDTQDTTPVLTKSVTVFGDRGIGSVYFDTIGFSKVRVQIINNNDFGVYLTVRLTEAKLQ